MGVCTNKEGILAMYRNVNMDIRDKILKCNIGDIIKIKDKGGYTLIGTFDGIVGYENGTIGIVVITEGMAKGVIELYIEDIEVINTCGLEVNL